jgi:predicted regulator of Ras-like GTPase activity (Roadblock/LC7/MglB family)
MDPPHAIADLTEISTQIEAAVLADRSGEPVASSLDDAGRARALAGAAAAIFAAAGEPEPAQVEAVTRDGSLFAVREGDRIVAAVTPSSAPSGLVLYDLRTCLRQLTAETTASPKRRTRKKTEDATA